MVDFGNIIFMRCIIYKLKIKSPIYVIYAYKLNWYNNEAGFDLNQKNSLVEKYDR